MPPAPVPHGQQHPLPIRRKHRMSPPIDVVIPPQQVWMTVNATLQTQIRQTFEQIMLEVIHHAVER
jgi:hypothetical protein